MPTMMVVESIDTVGIPILVNTGSWAQATIRVVRAHLLSLPCHIQGGEKCGLTVGISTQRVRWILDADIRGFFDHTGHEWMIRFLEHEIAGRRILRLIRKWLEAGVSEDGGWLETKQGTPPQAR